MGSFPAKQTQKGKDERVQYSYEDDFPRNSKLDSALYEAVHFGHVELIQGLLDQGAKPCQEASNSAPATAVDVFTAATTRAARSSDFDLEQLALRSVRAVHEVLKDFALIPADLRALIEAYCVFGRLDSLRWLYQAGLKPLPNVIPSIFYAIQEGDHEAVEIILHYEGPRLATELSPEDQATPLYRASYVEHYTQRAEWRDDAKCVQLLLEAKADPTEPGLLDNAFGHYRSPDVATALLKAGAHSLRPTFNPLWSLLSKYGLSESSLIEAVGLLHSHGLLRREHFDFTGLGQNPMCLPRYVPPDAIQYAAEGNKPKLAELLKSYANSCV